MQDEIFEYWFGDLKEDSDYFRARNALWFGGSEATDAEIRRRFGETLERAVLPGDSGVAPEFAAWAETRRGALALIVLIDQFSLNLYRERPESYRRSALVVPLVKDMIARGRTEELSVSESLFVFLPLEHAENVPDQDLSVACFEKLAARARGDAKEPAKFYLDYARRHSRVVHRFGRFPDRNAVFGRSDTPEEKAFLASDEAPF